MEDEQQKQAMISALRSLAAGDKSEHDLASKLRQKGFPEACIRITLTQLKNQGFLSDQVFAKKLSERILRGKLAGTHRLAFELKKKHIPEAIRKSILEAVDPEEQRLQAYELASRKVSGMRETDPRVLSKKLYDFLIRKGYDFQLAQETSRTVVSELKRRRKDDEND